MEKAKEMMRRVDEERNVMVPGQMMRMTREAQSLVADLLRAALAGKYEERLARFESCDGAVW
ncbi:hypothetical protein KVT40_001127 [Elsinoe batatas]|uniref:Uncharacterized protein n=1 Tax=Elsinoe batatas TaxID=2601811 RepID=A0A8K0L9Z7_9PEZI|nr:hypothetical protein KVT40_001127 [Elsinoe batatas]